MELWPAAESHASLNLSLFSHAWPVSSFQVGFLANDEASFAAALDAALSLVEQGLGIAVAPISPARLERARTRFTLVPFGELTRNVGLYINERHTKEALTEPLFKALQEECVV